MPIFNFKIFKNWYISVTVLITVYTLAVAAVHYYNTNDINYLFYHQLADPIYGHAVYVSFLILIALVLVLFDHHSYKNIPILMLFFVFLVFLSSKLFYLNLLIVIIYFLAVNRSWKAIWILLLPIISFSFILVFSNPVKDRIDELHFNPSYILNSEKFGNNIYFDDVSFHMLQFRNAYTILHDQKAWVFGVSKAESQNLLIKQYRKLDMFTGDKKNPGGYLIYNFHNQYLESLVYGGILQCLIVICLTFGLLAHGIHEKNHILILFSVIAILFCLIESVFETQVGIVCFLFFGCILEKAQTQLE